MLFNHQRDPLELENLYYRPGSAGVIRQLRARLEAWQRRVKDSAPLPA